MVYAITILIGLIALFHLYIMYFEMFAWESKGPKVFRNFEKEMFPKTKTMAANQGLYNGFLAAGLIWSLLISDPSWKWNVALFFVGCVFVAGVYGGMTASKKIFKVQAFPAFIALVLILLYKFNVV